MGLDMYLSKKTHVKNWNFDKDNNYSTIARNNGKKIQHIDTNKVTDIVEEIGYWRKSNHIHKWFVDNCQDGEDDCKSYYVESDQLKELKQLCEETKKYLDSCKKEVDKEYKDYYTFEVDEKDFENNVDFEYSSSW